MNRSIILGVLIASAVVPSAASAQELTVYSSLPLSGAARGQTRAVNDGARQALQEAGGTAAGRPVRLVTLNDANRRAGSWVPELVSRNARRAAQDGGAVAFIGAFNSGASAVAIPITNEAGLPMISPSNTAIGLTTGGPGTSRGEPDKYYPAGNRSYFRIIPNDKVQAAALATAMRDRGCTRIAAVSDRDAYGAGVGAIVRQDAARLGLSVVKSAKITRRTRSFGSITRARPDCVVYTGITANGAARMFNRVGGSLRGAKLFASDGVAESGVVDDLRASVARRVTLSVATLAPDAYPGGAVIGNSDPYKIYGYEAMKLIVDGLNAAGPSKAALLGWLRSGVQNRASVLGTYSLDANGDTTLRSYGLYGIQRRSLVWIGAISAA